VAALPSWVLATASSRVYVPKIWARFIPHIFSQMRDWDFIVEIPDKGADISLGKTILKVIPAHHMHSVGNFSLYDPVSKVLFSGDIGSSIFPPEKDYDFVENFNEYVKYMKSFHRRYMASNKACRSWVSKIRQLDIEVIAPQHGAIIKGKDKVDRFLAWLENLECGVDLL